MNILFLCTGNSCRSQIAEGWARHLGGDFFQAQSAGIESHGRNPRAIAVMQDVGVDISHQESTRLTDEMLASADYLVTVCGMQTNIARPCPQGCAKSTGRLMTRPGLRVQRKKSWRYSENAAMTCDSELRI